MTGRVPWSEYSGEDIERAVAMFIAMEHPTAVRITPSRGDGGVDILDRGERTVVYQVKGFHAALTGGQQKQVEQSIDRLTSDPRWAELIVDEWHLVTPWDPTPERLQWLRDYANSKGLPAPVWNGLADCDGWAAKHPYIVDYFFHGSKQKVQEAATQLLEGFRFKELAGGVPDDLTLGDVSEGMSSAVAFLNERDIYYDYGLAVGPPSPDGFLPQETDRPNLMTSVHQADKNIAVRIDVYAKTAISVQERPITGIVRMTATTGSPEDEAIRDFRKFGSPLDLPLGSVQADFDGPEVLAQQVRDGALSIWPVAGEGDGEPQLRLVVLDPAGEQITELLMDRQYTSRGEAVDGLIRGLESALVDPSACLRLVVRFDFDAQSTSFNFRITRPDGVLATDAYDALSAYRSVQRAGNTFILAPRFGPLVGDRMSAPPNAGTPEVFQLWLDIAKSLTLIQEHTHVRLYFPKDLSQVPESWIRDVCFHGALLNGQTRQKRVDEVFMPHMTDRPEPDEAGVLTIPTPWTLTLDETGIDLGFLVQEFTGTFKETTDHGQRGLVDVWTVEGGLRIRRPTPQEAVAGQRGSA